MRSITLAFALALSITLTLLTACSKEEPKTEPPAIETAEKPAGTSDLNTGRTIYEKSCAYCHTTGTLNAPVLGNKKVWAVLTNQGLEHMVKNAIFGIGKMPPKGGDHKLTDDEIKLAVEYIVEQSQ